MAFSHDGLTLASGGYQVVRLWDTRTGEHLRTLAKHRGRVNSIAFSPDGKTLAAGGGVHPPEVGYMIRLWNANTGERLHIMGEHSDRVLSVAFSPDGRTLASGSGDVGFASEGKGTIRLWDVRSGALQKMWDAYTGDPSFEGYGGSVRTVAFSPDGNTLASGSGQNDNRVRLWDARTGEHLRTLEGHTNDVTSVVFSPDGFTLASGSRDETILLWDVSPDANETRVLGDNVNHNGIVNAQDLKMAVSPFEQVGQNVADVNGDGVVNTQDLVLVAAALGTAGVVLPVEPQVFETLAPADIQRWLTDAKALGETDPTVKRGIAILEQLLAVLSERPAIPEQTSLLPNYPNPFNPETWIPYQLAEAVEVTMKIYDTNGQMVRELVFGHQPAGIYQSRSRAAYWDGRNKHGESVASGIYFCTLTADDFAATRKMLINK